MQSSAKILYYSVISNTKLSFHIILRKKKIYLIVSESKIRSLQFFPEKYFVRFANICILKVVLFILFSWKNTVIFPRNIGSKGEILQNLDPVKRKKKFDTNLNIFSHVVNIQNIFS